MTEDRIESRSNRKIKLYRSLAERDARERTGLMAAEGLRLVLEALASPLEATDLFLSDELGAEQAGRVLGAAGGQTAVHRVPEAVFRGMAHTVNPQGIAALVRLPPPRPDLPGPGNLAVLHRPQDPGNVGSILRSAEAAAFGGVIVIEPACDVFNPKSVRASMGSVFRLPVLRLDSLGELLGRLVSRGYGILAAEPRADKSLFDIELVKPLAVVFGSEAAGLSFPMGASVTFFRLPMAGGVESLNLAQAAAAVFYEIRRRELAKGASAAGTTIINHFLGG